MFHFYLTYLNLIPIDYLNRTKFVDYLKVYQRVLLLGCWFIDSTIACLHVVGHNFMEYLPPEILKNAIMHDCETSFICVWQAKI